MFTFNSLDCLTDDNNTKGEHKVPKAILPVAGKPMIHYQMEWLEAARAQDVLVVCPPGSKMEIQAQLLKYGVTPLKWKVKETKHGEGTADALRHVHEEIKTDFIVMACDVITDVSPHHLIDLHRIHNPAVTTLFYDNSKLDANLERPAKKDAYAQYVGIDAGKGRLVYTKQQEDVGDFLQLRTPMLRKFPKLSIHTNLRDAHVYIFKRWVLEVVVADPSISSIRKDLLRVLLQCQFSENARQKYGVATLKEKGIPFEEASLASSANSDDVETLLKCATERVQKKGEKTRDLPPHALEPKGHEVLCAAVVCGGDAFCARVNTPWSYAEVNRQKAKTSSASTPVDLRNKQTQIGSDSIVESSAIGERCSIKKSVIGKHCVIGKNVKITNSIIMDHVVIEDFVKLDGCIVSMNATISEKSQLKDCEVGPNHTVEKESVRTSEQLSQSHYLDIDQS
ncbi:nucleotide-diphospho-sugar transferase [Fimicolochytrium jonesii]|uniref:nucleotide-diphospho-sugar transferase n=1 Tax=Fimicolochytrium jonesii TaxID=1396493 RepID=UPI0022FDE819|nr:nucleotide-diphospho-sugar transferase [Fimicolochytrium jonesii]KAI8825742.1 nucleotide-diphospho-sugar transferase [Fimicolochytrium jonesii]